MASGPFYAVGVYVVEVVSQALGKASTGTPQFILRFKVLGMPIAGSEDYTPDQQQYERTLYMALTERTAPYVKENLAKLGYRGGGLATLDPASPAHDSFVGNLVDMYCKHKPDQHNNLRENWQISQGGIKVDPLDQREMRQLDAIFGKTTPRSLDVATRVSHVDQSTEITDDDIPF